LLEKEAKNLGGLGIQRMSDMSPSNIMSGVSSDLGFSPNNSPLDQEPDFKLNLRSDPTDRLTVSSDSLDMGSSRESMSS
jgi:hypothetical protein